MQATVRLIELEAKLVDTGNKETDAAIKDAIIGWAKKSESSSKINAALEQASALGTFAKNYADFDQKPHLLNVKNGTIDLKGWGLPSGTWTWGSELQMIQPGSC